MATAKTTKSATAKTAKAEAKPAKKVAAKKPAAPKKAAAPKKEVKPRAKKAAAPAPQEATKRSKLSLKKPPGEAQQAESRVHRKGRTVKTVVATASPEDVKQFVQERIVPAMERVTEAYDGLNQATERATVASESLSEVLADSARRYASEPAVVAGVAFGMGRLTYPRGRPGIKVSKSFKIAKTMMDIRRLKKETAAILRNVR